MNYIHRNDKLINLNLVAYVETRTIDMKHYIVFRLDGKEVIVAFDTIEQRDFEFRRLKDKLT